MDVLVERFKNGPVRDSQYKFFQEVTDEICNRWIGEHMKTQPERIAALDDTREALKKLRIAAEEWKAKQKNDIQEPVKEANGKTP
ncbi:MAG: hypothetical protein GWN86_27275 [Desulfobacterales bacterium]|nr:hypothetical protein [Desulfobacterales bacterium]